MKTIVGLMLFLLCTTSFANYAEVVLYYGQRDYGKSVESYQKSVIPKIALAERKIDKYLGNNRYTAFKFADKYNTKEHFIDVEVSSNLVCKIGILQITPKKYNGKSLLFYYGSVMDSYLSYIGLGAFDKSVLNEGYQVFVMDYPGFGLSECQPTEGTIIPTAVATYDYVSGLLQQDIPILGYSLGGAVGVQVAVQRPSVQSLLMVSTFANLAETADYLEKVEGLKRLKQAAKFKGFDTSGDYNELKKQLKERNVYNTAEHVLNVKAPVFIMHGKKDDVIPPGHFEQLVKGVKSTGKCSESELLGSSSHRQLFSINTSLGTNRFWNRIFKFLTNSACLN